jgi:ATP-binding cassette, subfamily F, member 3
MITLQELTLQRGSKILFNSASTAIFAKQKVAIVGINGSGKSSLLSLILGEIQPDAGNINMQNGLRIAHLSQEMPNTNISALQYVIEGDKELAQLLAQEKILQNDQNHPAIAELHHKLFEIGGYSAEAKAAKLLNGLGFEHKLHQKSVNEFSGGWRMRLNLGQVLMCRSDVLMLDEPTNHLDLDAIIWLERWLQRYEGTIILISHDRDFLDNIANKIIHLHNQKLETYSGNYSDFEEQRAEKLNLEKALHTKQQKQIAHLEKFVDRFRYKATKAKQAQSRLKALEKMQKVSLTHIETPFTFSFYSTTKCSSTLLSLEEVSFGYAEQNILNHINFSLQNEDRIGLLGPNGAGKSTFIKLLVGMLQPRHGTITINPNLKIGYFAQHQLEQLDINSTAFEHLKKISAKNILEQELRNFLGGFGFHADMVFQPIKYFSGGEKARLCLALLVAQKPNLLLLDEPTNHLDLDMRAALTYALQDYTGALIVVSHDRYLLRATVNDFYLVYDQKVDKFDGDLNDYQHWLLQTKNIQATTTTTKTNIKINHKQIQTLEKKLTKLNLEQEEIEKVLTDHSLYTKENAILLETKLKRLAEIKKDVETLEEQWLKYNN